MERLRRHRATVAMAISAALGLAVAAAAPGAIAKAHPGHGHGHGGEPPTSAPASTTTAAAPVPGSGSSLPATTATAPAPPTAPNPTSGSNPPVAARSPAQPTAPTKRAGGNGNGKHGNSKHRNGGTTTTTAPPPPASGIPPTGAGTAPAPANTTNAPAATTAQPVAPAAPARSVRREPGKRGVARQHRAAPAPRTVIRSVIQRFIDRVPGSLWLALGAAVAVAALAAALAAASTLRARRKAREIVAVSAAALVDPLTGVFNRGGFVAAAERELGRARRYGRELAFAYVDIRGLKKVNDSHGHGAGDRLIQETAALLTDSARREDVVARLGGDELALLLIEQSAATAGSVVARIEREVPAAQARLGLTAPWELTIGVASYPGDGDTVDELMACADRRLYERRGIAIA